MLSLPSLPGEGPERLTPACIQQCRRQSGMQRKGFHNQATGLTFQLASYSFAAAEKRLSWLHHCCKPEENLKNLKLATTPYNQ